LLVEVERRHVMPEHTSTRSESRDTYRRRDDGEEGEVSERRVGTREEWLAARKGLLEREKELTRLSDELARQRQELPWVPVDKEYRFESDEGSKTLAELFDGRSQLLVYHLMFGPDDDAACPGCSFYADHLDGSLAHLNHHDVTLVCASRAPLDKIHAYKRRIGWTFPYVSAFGTDFNFDFGASFKGEQQRKIAEEILPGFADDDVVAEPRPRSGPTSRDTSRRSGQACARLPSRTAWSTRPTSPRK